MGFCDCPRGRVTGLVHHEPGCIWGPSEAATCSEEECRERALAHFLARPHIQRKLLTGSPRLRGDLIDAFLHGWIAHPSQQEEDPPEEDPLFDPYIDPVTGGPTVTGILCLQLNGWEQDVSSSMDWWREPGSKEPRQYVVAIRMMRGAKNRGASR